MLLWCLWLLGSWCVAMRVDAVLPATRLMLFASIIGIMFAWPALRLGQHFDRAVVAQQVLWDWLCLNIVFQTVIWPLQVTAGWTLSQALWIDAAIASWSLLTGVVLAAGMKQTTSRGRMLGMILCMGLLLGEPLLMILLSLLGANGNGPSWLMRLSPIDMLALLTAVKPGVSPGHILGIALLALAGWIQLGRRMRRGVSA